MSKQQQRSVNRRLFDYIMLFRGQVAGALTILILAMGAQLAGPLIARSIIDDHILAIEKDWIELRSSQLPEGVQSVPFGGYNYIRSDWLNEQGRQALSEHAIVHIVQQESGFVLQSSAQGEVQLSAADTAAFYRHDMRPVLLLVGLIIVLAIAASGLNFSQSYMLQKTAQRAVQRIRMDVFRNLHRMPIRYFDQTPVGQIVSRVANDTENIKELYMSFLSTFVVSGLNIAGVFAALLYLDWRMALVCSLLLPIYALVMVLHLKYSRKYVAAIRARLAEMNAMLSEVIQIMPVLQAFRREQAVQTQFEQLNENRYRNQRTQFRIFAFSGRNAVYFIGRIFTAAIIWYFGSGSLEGAVSFGVFYAFIDYLGRIFEPIIGIFDQLMNAQRAVVSAERVFELMDEPGQDVAETRDVPRPQGHVEFQEVTFGYVPGQPVLNRISFEARRGETIALVGHTGSGKSSIMNLLLGFYEPDHGAICIDGIDIRSMSRQELRRHMGIVLQDPFLFTGDIRFNVTLYKEEISPAQVLEVLEKVGAADFVSQLQGGLAEPVVERGATLSAGQRQLISFARALAFDPAVLILDEATSSVDSETEAVIQKALGVLRHGRTTFIIAHRLSTIKDADRILVLHRGSIVERGTHAELMAQQGRYYRMYQLQSGENIQAAGGAGAG